MADPLTILKQYNLNNKLDEILEKEDKIIFGDLAWPKNVDTNYILWGTGKDGIPKEYYSLECVLFLLKNVKKAHPKYVKDAAKENIPVVRRPDRRELLAYLNADFSSSNSIDRSAPLELPIQIKKINDDKIDFKQTKFEEEKLLKDKERLSAWLDAPKEAQLSTENIRSLSDAMSIEKIAQIKAKRLAKKRSTIKGTLGDISNNLDNYDKKHDDKFERDDNVNSFQSINQNDKNNNTVANDLISQPISHLSKLRTKSANFVDSELDFTKYILSREQIWKTRENILQSAGKVFSLNINAILHSIKTQEQNLMKPLIKEPLKTSNMSATLQSNQTLNMGQQQQYSRYDQERFRANEEVADFKIDTMGTYHGMTLKSVAQAAHHPNNSANNVTKRQTLTPNNVSITSHTPLSHKHQSQGLSSATMIKTNSLNTSNSLSSYKQKSAVSGGTSKRGVSRTPIIIIPATASSLVTMINAKDILQDLKYVSEEEKRLSGSIRENDVLIQRVKDGGLSVPYRIIDNPLKLASHDWDRVVAVFVQGPAWQFKGWPWDGNPVEIFSKIKAYHLKWEEMKLDTNVAKWDVHIIPLSRTKRHLDRASLLKFWEVLDKHTAKNKPHLRT